MSVINPIIKLQTQNLKKFHLQCDLFQKKTYLQSNKFQKVIKNTNTLANKLRNNRKKITIIIFALKNIKSELITKLIIDKTLFNFMLMF